MPAERAIVFSRLSLLHDAPRRTARFHGKGHVLLNIHHLSLDVLRMTKLRIHHVLNLDDIAASITTSWEMRGSC